MRIAFVAQPFDVLDPPVRGGSLAIWIYQVARRCAQLGHETHVFANHGGRFGGGSTLHENVQYVYTATGPNSAINYVGTTVRRLAERLRQQPSVVPTYAAAWQDAGYAYQTARALKRLGCDAVLVMNYSQFVPIIRRVYPQCKIYLYMQCEWLTQLDRATISRRIAAADLISGVSEYITNKIVERFPEHAAKCVTLHNAGLPAADGERLETGDKTVLFVGRVSPEKGIHVLVDSFHEVLKSHPDARLHIVGGVGSAPLEFMVGVSDDPHVVALSRFYQPLDDSGRDPYIVHLERAAGHELEKRIIFKGRVDHDETSAAYRTSSVLVNPSLSESFGMSLVEAGMYGVPVVATRIGGMPFIVNHGETGLIVDPSDAKGLASAICRILDDGAMARAMGEAGRQRALTKFSWDHTAETLLRQWQSIGA